MKLYLLRHLQSIDNEQDINGSQTDAPLSESGKRQAQEFVADLANNKYDIFIVSPLQRTIQTLQPYLNTLDNPKVIIEPLTIERDLGLLTNSRAGDSQIAKHREESGTDRISWKPPQGESISDVYLRAKKFFNTLKKLNGNSVLMCGHQNFLRCLELFLLNRPIEDFYSDNLPRLANGEMRSYIIN